MGTNDPNFPNTVLSHTGAEQYLASRAAAKRNALGVGKTGSPTLAAAEVIDAITELSGGAAATITLPAAAALITQMQAADANAAVGSQFEWNVVNSNSGILTITPGANTTFASVGGASIPTLVGAVFIVKWATATTVTLFRKS